MSSEPIYQEHLNDVKEAVAIIAVIAGSVLTLLMVVFFAFWMAGVVTAGPKEDARNWLYQNCQERFEIGVYDEPCISILRNDGP